MERAGPLGVGGPSGLWVEWEQGGVRLRLPLNRPLSIGRDASCDVRLAEPTVSRRHAVVSIVGGGPFVDATASTNGITLDRGRDNQVALSPGQSFRIGETVFRVVAGPTAQPVAARPAAIPLGHVAHAGRNPRTQRQSLLPFAAIGAVCLVVVLAIGGVAMLNRSAGASGGAQGADSTDGTGIAPPVEPVSSGWAAVPSVTPGVTLRYPQDWQVEQSSDGTAVVLSQPGSPNDRPVPTINISFEPGVAVTGPPTTDGMSTPEPIIVAGLQGWEYHQVGLVAPSAATFIDLPYHGGRLQMAATRGPAVNLVPQLDEILKTLAVAQ